MSVNDPQRVKLKVQSWDVVAGHGVVVDREGFAYPIELSKLTAEFHVVQPRPGEFLEGIVRGPGEVVSIVSPGLERANFDSAGPNPDGAEIASLRGLALEGGRPQRFGKPHDGRFSDGRETFKD